MGHSTLLAALLPPVSYDVNAPGVEVSLAVDGAELDRVQAASAAVLGALQPWKWQQYLPDWERVSPSARLRLLPRMPRALRMLCRLTRPGVMLS